MRMSDWSSDVCSSELSESDITVYDDAVKVLEKLEEQNPSVHFTQLFTTVDYAKDQYSSAMEALVEGAILAVIVVFLFLRDWRATLISALAIPLSAIPTFWFMDLMGFTLNSMTRSDEHTAELQLLMRISYAVF